MSADPGAIRHAVPAAPLKVLYTFILFHIINNHTYKPNISRTTINLF